MYDIEKNNGIKKRKNVIIPKLYVYYQLNYDVQFFTILKLIFLLSILLILQRSYLHRSLYVVDEYSSLIADN